MSRIDQKEELRKIYGQPGGRAAIKVLDTLEEHSKHFISLSPFVVISTVDERGHVDASPRGGHAGFVHVLDNQHLIIPDSKGNNRVDSLANIVATGRIGMLFMLPGVNETLRVNGSAEVLNDPVLLGLFPEEKNPPKSVIKVHVEEMFLHCAKAFMRSQLWNSDRFIDRADFPSMGRMLNDQLNTDNPEETQEQMEKRYSKDL